jgi:hypothetical protein
MNVRLNKFSVRSVTTERTFSKAFARNGGHQTLAMEITFQNAAATDKPVQRMSFGVHQASLPAFLIRNSEL